MLDISNKLHAMVDEFVSSLSSECDTLANKLSSHASKCVAPVADPDPAPTPRLSNRTTTEVLNGLRRPSDAQLVDNRHQEEKSQKEPVTPDFTGGPPRGRVDGRSLRPVREEERRSRSLDSTHTLNNGRSLDVGSSHTAAKAEAKHVRGKPDMAAIGEILGHIEILSSDQSSDECVRARLKYSKQKHTKLCLPKTRPSSARARPSVREPKSPSLSRESSHTLNYSYEEETTSIGGRSQAIETSGCELIWPQDDRGVNEGWIEKKSRNNHVASLKATHKKSAGKDIVGEISQDEGDESNEDDVEGNPLHAQSDEEEIPVLPKVPVKRKSLDAKGCERRTQRGRAKSASPQTKKQKTPQLDASVITQLSFGRRPQNCVSLSFALTFTFLPCMCYVCHAE